MDDRNEEGETAHADATDGGATEGISRRTYVKLTGTSAASLAGVAVASDVAEAASYGESGYGEGPYGGGDAVTVYTYDATSVGSSSATLNGELANLGGADSADCYFEWGESGGSLPNSTSTQTLSSTGSFDESISGLSTGTEYAFQAVAAASDGDTDTGSTVTFTTDSGSTAPAIDSYSVTEADSPNPHCEITADWSVSDADSDLDIVAVEVFDSSGSLVDAATTDVSGSTASGTDQFEIKHAEGQTFDVVLTVTDSKNDSSSETRSITE